MLNTLRECALSIKTGDFADEILKTKINFECTWDSDYFQATKSKYKSFSIPTEDINFQALMEIQFEDNSSAQAFRPFLEDMFKWKDIEKIGTFQILDSISNNLYINIKFNKKENGVLALSEEIFKKLTNFEEKKMSLEIKVGAFNTVNLLLD